MEIADIVVVVSYINVNLDMVCNVDFSERGYAAMLSDSHWDLYPNNGFSLHGQSSLFPHHINAATPPRLRGDRGVPVARPLWPPDRECKSTLE